MTDPSDSSRKEAEEIVRRAYSKPLVEGETPPIITEIAASLHAREQERERLTALVEVLTDVLGKYATHPSEDCSIIKHQAKQALSSPSLAPLLERRRLEREASDLLREVYESDIFFVDTGEVHRQELDKKVRDLLDRLDAQGKEKDGG